MSKFFDYKWKNDRNQALDDDEELEMMMQLPDEVRDKLYSGFLFNDFLTKFQMFFRIEKKQNVSTFTVSNFTVRNFYTWKDQPYREFMQMVLTMLEPRFEPKHQIIVGELDEFSELIFVSKGTIVIGYEINKLKNYCIQYVNKCVIGAFEVTFNQRSSFIYTALTNIHGYSIRKKNWVTICNENEEMFKIVKQNLLMLYITQIKCKVQVKKMQAIKKMYLRKDHQQIYASAFKDEFDTKKILEQNMNRKEKTKEEMEEDYIDYQKDHLYAQIDKSSVYAADLLDQVEARDAALADLYSQLKMVRNRKKKLQKLKDIKCL